MKKQSIKKWVKNLIPANKSYNSQTPKQQQFEVEKFYEKYPDDSTAEAELINQLIHMNTLIRITRQINYQQYLLLNQINTMLGDGAPELNNIKKALLGGINIFDQYSKKRYISHQLPYQYYSLRALLWKISIGYLNKREIHKWVSKMQKHYAQYKSYANQLIVLKIQKKKGVLSHTERSQSSEEKIQEKEQKKKDHPLNFSGLSKWKSYFDDVQLWKRIEKDILRTRKQCKFFQEEYQFFSQKEISLRPAQVTFSQQHSQTYADAITRILFIYLKNHPEQSYVQGMNEIAAIIFYSFTNKNSEYMRRVSESDSYFFLQIILSRFPKKHFLRGEQYAKKFIQIMKKIDLRLFQEIEQNKMVEPFKAISIRWFLTGFLSEFSADDSLLIWDYIVSWSEELGIINSFMYVGLAILHLNRTSIIEKQNLLLIFSKIKNSPIQIIEKSQSLYKLFPKLLSS